MSYLRKYRRPPSQLHFGWSLIITTRVGPQEQHFEVNLEWSGIFILKKIMKVFFPLLIQLLVVNCIDKVISYSIRQFIYRSALNQITRVINLWLKNFTCVRDFLYKNVLKRYDKQKLGLWLMLQLQIELINSVIDVQTIMTAKE